MTTDLFERVTLYDLKVGAPTATRRPDGRWDIAVPVEAHKFYADEKGKEKEAPLFDLIDVSLSRADQGDEAGRRDIILHAKRKIRSGKHYLRFVTDQRPTEVSFDPHGLYIDRDRNDNFADVSQAAA